MFKKHYGVRLPNARARRNWKKLARHVKSWGSYPHLAPGRARAMAWQVYRGARARRLARFYGSIPVRMRLAQRFYETAHNPRYAGRKRKR